MYLAISNWLPATSLPPIASHKRYLAEKENICRKACLASITIKI